MSLFDRLSGRVGDFFDEVLLPEEVRQAHERARQAIERGEYEVALQILQAADRSRPNIERTRHLIALCHFYRGELERAVELFREAIELREEPSSHFYAALALEQLRRPHEAQLHYTRALQAGDDLPFAFDLYFGLGRVFLAQGRPDKAIRELRKALKRSPDQPEAALTLAEALLERGRPEEAREAVRAADSTAAGRRALLTIARIEEACGDSQAARRSFERVLEHDDTNQEALVGAARNALATHDHARAHEYLLRALAEANIDERVDIYVLLGQANELVGNDARALENYETALAAAPSNVEARLGVARLRLRTGDAAGAADAFQAVLTSGDGRHSREALAGLGRCRLEAGDFAGARHLLEEAARLSSAPDPEILHALGLVALRSGDAAEAVVSLREALHAAETTRRHELASRIEADVRNALERLRPPVIQALRQARSTPDGAASGDDPAIPHAPSLPDDAAVPDDTSLPDDPASLVDLLHQVHALCQSDARLAPFLPRAAELIAAMDAPLAIAILGEFNAGKSTLINALLGEEVVPMGVLPTTAHPCIMQYGPRKATRIVYADGHLEEVSFEEARVRMKRDANAIARLEYLYPHPELRSVHFWDTPGFNALDERHEEAASWALENGEAILWVLDANQVLSHTEFERIEAVPAGNERLIVLINKVDRLGPASDEALAELVEYVEDNAGDHIAGVFPISALEALRAHAAEGPAPERFEAFRGFLDRTIVQRSSRIKVLEVRRNLLRLLVDLVAFGRELVATFARTGEDTAALRRWLEEEAAVRPVGRARREAAELTDRIDFVVTGVEREVAEALRPRGTLITRMVLGDEDRAFILQLYKERLQSVLERSRRAVLNEVSVLESELAERVTPILSALSLQNQRAMNRRLEGFFDETRVLKMLLVERVYGQFEAKAIGQIDGAGPGVLAEIAGLDEAEAAARRRVLLRELVPEMRTDFRQALSTWYEEFFLAATRFCGRLARDLALLELEARYRYDFTPLSAPAPDTADTE